MGRGRGVDGGQRLAEQDAARLGLGSRSHALPNPASRTIPLLIRPVELSDGERLTILTLADLERSDPARARPGSMGESPGWDCQEIRACGSLDTHGISAAPLVKILIRLEREGLVEAGSLTRGPTIKWALSGESRRLFFAPDVAEEISGHEEHKHADGSGGLAQASQPRRRTMNW